MIFVGAAGQVLLTAVTNRDYPSCRAGCVSPLVYTASTRWRTCCISGSIRAPALGVSANAAPNPRVAVRGPGRLIALLSVLARCWRTRSARNHPQAQLVPSRDLLGPTCGRDVYARSCMAAATFGVALLDRVITLGPGSLIGACGFAGG